MTHSSRPNEQFANETLLHQCRK